MDHDEAKYLGKRAKLIFDFLCNSNSKQLLPDRDAWKKDVEVRIREGKVRRLRILNNIFDTLIIEANDLGSEEKYELMKLLTSEIGEGENEILLKKRAVYDQIIQAGHIKSRIQINDAISIRKSQILGLSDDEKARLFDIILSSMASRI